MDKNTYESVLISVEYVRTKSSQAPKIGIICGSGLGGIGEKITDKTVIPYRDIPGFASSEVVGHKSQLLLGKLNGVNVVCMQGRIHGYEGIPYSKCAFPIRVMKLLGAEKLIVTAAAGSVNPDYKVGDFMILKDHLPIALWGGFNPLTGKNDDRFGPRFPAISQAYCRELQDLAERTASELGMSDSIHRGVYTMYSGPSYETIAEAKLFRAWGSDCLGMSVAPEVIVASHCGMKVLSIAMITNCCILDYDNKEIANHADVVEVAKKRALDMETLVSAVVSKMDSLE